MENKARVNRRIEKQEGEIRRPGGVESKGETGETLDGMLTKINQRWAS